MSEEIIYVFSVSSQYINTEKREEINVLEVTGYSLEDWDELGEKDQEQVVQEMYEEWVWNNIEAGYWLKEE